jgi:hypoxanthine phosphoribosyltransferase
MKILINEKQISDQIRVLANDINLYYQSKEVVIISFLKGSFIFAADLIRELNLDLKLEFLEASSYGSSTESSGKVNLVKDIQMLIENKHVLILEDIIDTGISLNYLAEHILNKKPASLQICTLLLKYKKHSFKYPIQFIGFNIEDEFVVGYGMDYNEKFRNLKYIAVLGE